MIRKARRIGRPILAALLLSTVAASPGLAQESGAGAGQGAQLGVHAGTLGLGLSGGYDLSEILGVRGLINYFDYSYDRTLSGNEYEGDLELRSLGLLADWYPLGGGFRVTGGFFADNNELSARAMADDLDINGEPYGARLDARAGFEALAPYLGIGWSSRREGAGLSFLFDAGVLFLGSPDLTVSGSITGGGCTFSVAKDGQATLRGDGCPDGLQADLEAEHGDLRDDLDDFELYPVVSAGLAYRF